MNKKQKTNARKELEMREFLISVNLCHTNLLESFLFQFETLTGIKSDYLKVYFFVALEVFDKMLVKLK